MNRIPGDVAERSRELPDLSMHKITALRQAHFMNFEEIQSIEDLERVSEETAWQNFERLAAFIFEKNDCMVKVNTVKTYHKMRRQYDVIARKHTQTFLVECKKWAGNRYRLSALKRAIEQHKERTTFYERITGEDAIPIVVTLVEEEILVYEGVPIVPIQKLDSFIHELDTHITGDSFTEYEDIMSFPGDMHTESEDPSEAGEGEIHAREFIVSLLLFL